MKRTCMYIIIILPSLLYSQGSSRGAVTLTFPATPFAAATGESFVADPAALQSILINPANIASRETYGILFSHTEWIQDIRTEYLSMAAPLKLGSLSLSIGNTSIDGLELRTLPGPALGTFNVQATSFQLTYGVELTPRLRLGAASKYLYEKIFVDEATGYGFDAGILYTLPMEGLELGCSLTNVGSLSAFRNERTELPSQIRFGGTYSCHVNAFDFRAAATFASEFGSATNRTCLGGEATYDQTISVRVGYQTGIDARGFSAGLGIRYKFIVVDYAYVPFSMQIGNSHLISIGFEL